MPSDQFKGKDKTEKLKAELAAGADRAKRIGEENRRLQETMDKAMAVLAAAEEREKTRRTTLANSLDGEAAPAALKGEPKTPVVIQSPEKEPDMTANNFEELFLKLREVGNIRDSQGRITSAEDIIERIKSARKFPGSIQAILPTITNNRSLRTLVRNLLEAEQQAQVPATQSQTEETKEKKIIEIGTKLFIEGESYEVKKLPKRSNGWHYELESAKEAVVYTMEEMRKALNKGEMSITEKGWTLEKEQILQTLLNTIETAQKRFGEINTELAQLDQVEVKQTLKEKLADIERRRNEEVLRIPEVIKHMEDRSTTFRKTITPSIYFLQEFKDCASHFINDPILGPHFQHLVDQINKINAKYNAELANLEKK